MIASTPIYAPLASKLRDAVQGGLFKAGEQLGTEVGLAAESGISRSSVRLAVRDLIREGLVERRAGKGIFVCQAPPEVRVVEIVLSDLGGMWTDLANGAQDQGVLRGAKLHVYNANRDFEADIRAIRLLPTSGVAGAIIGALHRSRMNHSLVQLWHTGFPFVLCDQRMQDIDVPSVVFDNHRAGYLAAQELLRLGHRRLAFIGYPIPGLTGSRLEGFRDALNDAGLPFDQSLACIRSMDADVPSQAPSCEDFLTTLVARHDRPSAIVFHTESLAVSGCRILKRLGIRIPGHMSVVVIGRERPFGLSDPPLATVDLPFQEMGRVAIEMLLRRLEDPKGPVEHRVLPVKWVARESVMARSGG